MNFATKLKIGWRNLGIWGKIAIILGITGIAVSIFFGGKKNEIKIGNNVNLNNSALIQDSPGAKLIINESKQIPYTKVWEIPSSKWRQEKWIELYNVEYIFPDGQKAFVPRLEETKTYILGYTNDDCSDTKVSDKYKMPENIKETDICFIHRLSCSEQEMTSTIDRLYAEGKKEEARQYVGPWINSSNIDSDTDKCSKLK